MADMIVVYRIMPEDGEVEYSELESTVKEIIETYDSSVKIKEINSHNVGFGLQAVKIKIQIDEKCGSEALEEKIKSNELVGDVIVELMDRL